MYQYCTRVPVTEIIKYYIYSTVVCFLTVYIQCTVRVYSMIRAIYYYGRMGDTSVYFFIPDFFVGLFEATDFYQKFGCRW